VVISYVLLWQPLDLKAGRISSKSMILSSYHGAIPGEETTEERKEQSLNRSDSIPNLFS
jgi:hypothetical protein